MTAREATGDIQQVTQSIPDWEYDTLCKRETIPRRYLHTLSGRHPSGEARAPAFEHGFLPRHARAKGGRDVKREELRERQAAEHGDAEWTLRLASSTEADGERQGGESCGETEDAERLVHQQQRTDGKEMSVVSRRLSPGRR